MKISLMRKVKVVLFVVFTVLAWLSTAPVMADNPFGDLISGTKIYFSHIATTQGWETEIAILNPTTQMAAGTLTFYDNNGQALGNTVAINLPAHGRYQAEVGKLFQNAAAIAYIVLTSENFGLKGYSKFYINGLRASIMASGPRTTGLFTKIDHEGWTGIAFINTASSPAQITLTAYSDAGVAVAVETLSVDAGAKVVNPVEKIFSQSLAGATYVSYTSNHGVVGFFLNGSGDNTMLDGSQAL